MPDARIGSRNPARGAICGKTVAVRLEKDWQRALRRLPRVAYIGEPAKAPHPPLGAVTAVPLASFLIMLV